MTYTQAIQAESKWDIPISNREGWFNEISEMVTSKLKEKPYVEDKEVKSEA